MAVRLGNKEKFYIRTVSRVQPTPGGSYVNVTKYNWLGCETANSLGRTQEAVECSDKSNDWAKYIAGKRGGTIEATAYIEAEGSFTGVQQRALLDSLHNGQKVWIFIGQKATGTGIFDDDTITEGDLMQGVISGISDTNDFGAVASRTFNLTVDGEIQHFDEEEEEE